MIEGLRRYRAPILGACAVLVALAIVAGVPPLRERAVAVVRPPAPTADTATMSAQGAAAERAIARAYVKATDQLRKTRELRLAITLREADAIEARARDELGEVRRRALAALADAFGLAPNARDAFVAAAEARTESTAAASPVPVLLAPQLTGIIRQADQLCAKIADDATRALTAPAPSGSPRP